MVRYQIITPCKSAETRETLRLEYDKHGIEGWQCYGTYIAIETGDGSLLSHLTFNLLRGAQ